MRITSISKQCYEEYKKNNFKKVTKFKRVNKRFVRYQFISFSETLDEIIKKKVPMKEFWNVIDEIKDSERINIKDKYNKVLLLDKSRHGTDTNKDIKDQVTM